VRKEIAIAAVVLAAAAAATATYVCKRQGPPHYTGFVEGEERIIRSEVSGRVVEIRYEEGDQVPPQEIIAVLDDRDVQAHLQSKREELAVLDAEIRTQSERLALVERTWERDVKAQRAEVRQAEAAAELARRTFDREQELVHTGASTLQRLDDSRALRDQSSSALDRARQVLAKVEAEERSIALARHERETLRARHSLAEAQLEEIKVTQSKYVVRSPRVATVLQTQFIWPGELAQPGTAIVSLLDPKDKYVQIYVPVADLSQVRVGQAVEIELDSRPGHRVAGEVSFIADQANFTPEKIETRSDRMGQVYRAKVHILNEVERFQPGTEGNVYLKP
jgi:HlyD family secretion protein